MSGFVFHPDAFADLDDIWEFIAKDSLDAADRILDEIHATILKLVAFPHLGHARADLTSKPLRFHPVRDYLSPILPKKSRSSSLRFSTVAAIPALSPRSCAEESSFITVRTARFALRITFSSSPYLRCPRPPQNPTRNSSARFPTPPQSHTLPESTPRPT
jgi:plasmid stabilization system protein ParE